MSTRVILHLQKETQDPLFRYPTQTTVQNWIKKAATAISSTAPKKVELTLRIVDDAESAHLNQTFRGSKGKKGPTNVLSFPSAAIPGETTKDYLGDIVICLPQVIKEALQQHKLPRAHFIHLIIHGFLHLLGYDHEEKNQAAAMENLEIHILEQLRISNPYLISEKKMKEINEKKKMLS